MKDRMKIMTALAAVVFMCLSTADDTDAGWFESSLIGDSRTPITEEEFIHQWTTNASILENKTITGWAHIPGVPVITDDHVYIRINGIIYKLDIYSGEEIASAESLFGNNMFGHWIGCAECNGGMIFDGLNQRAFDMDLNPLYDFDRTHVKFFYYGGKIYGIDSAGVSVYEPGSGTESTRITYTGTGTNQSPVFVGYYMYAINRDGDLNISSYSLITGEFVNAGPALLGSIYSDPTYHNCFVYVTTYGSTADGCQVYRLPVSEGNIDVGNVKSVKIHDAQVEVEGTSYKTTTSSLIPYAVDGKNLGFVKTNIGFYVIDLDSADLDIITSVDTAGEWNGNGRGGISMTDAYFAESGKLYFYAIPYAATKEIILYTYSYDGSTSAGEEHKVTYQSLVFPEISKQFNTENVFFGKDGQLIWHNDSGNLFCFGSPSYNVKFECNSGSGIEYKSVFRSSCCAKPADPVKDGHTFAGWYTDPELTNEHDFSNEVSGHTTLYAKWVASGSPSGDGGNDNTIYYVAGGAAAVAVVVGLVYFLLIRKP